MSVPRKQMDCPKCGSKEFIGTRGSPAGGGHIRYQWECSGCRQLAPPEGFPPKEHLVLKRCVHEVKKERDEARHEARVQRSRADRAEAERRTLLRAQNDITDRTEEAEREADDLGARCQELEAQRDAYEVEANKAHGEAQELRAENERLRKERYEILRAGGGLRSLLSQYSPTNRAIQRWDDSVVWCVDSTVQHVKENGPDQPAPQVHYRETPEPTRLADLERRVERLERNA